MQAFGMALSVIIPTLNEEDSIAASISSALAGAPLEVLVVDGGSLDRTQVIARAMGATVFQSARPGRAIQMNLGARQAKSNVLLFLHADTILPQNYSNSIAQAIERKKEWGFFKFALNAHSLHFRLLEICVLLRSHIFRLFYGDQAMFVTKEFFEHMGGFHETAALEDLDFLLRGMRVSQPCLLKERVVTSARRWNQHGFWRVTLQNQIKLIRFLLEG